MHSTGCKKYPLSCGDFVLAENLPAKTFSLPLKKLHLNTVGHFFSDPTDKKRASAARAIARAKPVARAVEKCFSLEEGVRSLVRAT